MAMLPARLPSGGADRAGVRPGEKVVAWATARGEVGLVIATDRALYLEMGQRRMPWSTIRKATWSEPILTLYPTPESGRSARVLTVELSEARDVPAAVHDRVTASVVVSQRIDLDGRGAAVIVARRDSDDGQIRWSVVFDAGLDPADPGLRRAADAALKALRDSLGI